MRHCQPPRTWRPPWSLQGLGLHKGEEGNLPLRQRDRSWEAQRGSELGSSADGGGGERAAGGGRRGRSGAAIGTKQSKGR
jgi:hypothetical protein